METTLFRIVSQAPCGGARQAPQMASARSPDCRCDFVLPGKRTFIAPKQKRVARARDAIFPESQHDGILEPGLRPGVTHRPEPVVDGQPRPVFVDRRNQPADPVTGHGR